MNRHAIKARSNAESQAREDCELVGCIPSFDVERWISFSESEPLGLRQHFLERAAGSFHLCENEVAGAVEDAAHSNQLLCDETFSECFHNRYAACNCCFE